MVVAMFESANFSKSFKSAIQKVNEVTQLLLCRFAAAERQQAAQWHGVQERPKHFRMGAVFNR